MIKKVHRERYTRTGLESYRIRWQPVEKTLAELEEMRQTLIKKGWKNITMGIDFEELTFSGVVTETDQEYKERIAREEAEIARLEEARALRDKRKNDPEYKQYLKLKKKFQ